MAEFRPTRSVTVKPQGSSGADLSGVFNVAKSTQDIANTLGSLAQNSLKIQKQSAQDKQVLDAMSDSGNFFDEDGNINKDFASYGEKYWYSGAKKVIQEVGNRNALQWAIETSKLLINAHNKLYPTGNEEGADKAKTDLIEELNKKNTDIADYEIASGEYRNFINQTDASIDIFQEVNKEIQNNNNAYQTILETSNATIENLGVLVRGTGLANNNKEVTSQFENIESSLTAIDALAVSANIDKNAQKMQITSDFANTVFTSSVLNMAITKANKSVDRNDRENVYSPRQAFIEIAQKLEEDPNYAKEILFPLPKKLQDILLPFIDVNSVSDTLRAEARIFNENRTFLNNEQDRIDNNLLNEQIILMNNATNFDELSNISSGMTNFLKSLSSDKLSYQITFEKNLEQAKARLREAQRVTYSENKKIITASMTPIISALSNNDPNALIGTPFEGSSIEYLKQYIMQGLSNKTWDNYPEVRKSLFKAFVDSGNKTKTESMNALRFAIEHMNSRPINSQDWMSLVKLAESAGIEGKTLLQSEYNKSRKGNWNTIAEIFIEKVKNDQPFVEKNINLPQTIEEFKKQDYENTGGENLAKLNEALFSSRGKRLDEAQSNFKLMSELIYNVNQDGSVELLVTPEQYEIDLVTAVDEMKKNYPSKGKDIDDFATSQLSKIQQYKKAYKKWEKIFDTLSVLEQNNQGGRSNVSQAKFIQTHAPFPTFTPFGDPEYPQKLNDYFVKWGIFPDSFMNAFKDALMSENPVQAVGEIMQGFNDAIAAHQDVHGENDGLALSIKNQLDGSITGDYKDTQLSEIFDRLVLKQEPINQVIEDALKGRDPKSFNSNVKAMGDLQVNLEEFATNDLYVVQTFMEKFLSRYNAWDIMHVLNKTFLGAEDLPSLTALEEWFDTYLVSNPFADSPNGALFFGEIYARPDVASNLAKTIRTKMINIAERRNLKESDMFNIFMETLNGYSGQLGIEFVNEGIMTPREQAVAQSYLRNLGRNAPSPQDSLFGDPLGELLSLGTFLNLSISPPTKLSVRLAVNPIDQWFSTKGWNGKGLPPEIKHLTRSILNADMMITASNRPDSFFQNIGVERDTIRQAIFNGNVEYISNTPFGNTDPSKQTYSVIVNTTIQGVTLPVVLYDDYSPNWEMMQSYGDFDSIFNPGPRGAADIYYEGGASFQVMNNDLFKIKEAWWSLGLDKNAMVSAFKNTLENEPQQLLYTEDFYALKYGKFDKARGRLLVDSINFVLELNGKDPIVVTDKFLEENNNFWKFFVKDN